MYVNHPKMITCPQSRERLSSMKPVPSAQKTTAVHLKLISSVKLAQSVAKSL